MSEQMIVVGGAMELCAALRQTLLFPNHRLTFVSNRQRIIELTRSLDEGVLVLDWEWMQQEQPLLQLLDLDANPSRVVLALVGDDQNGLEAMRQGAHYYLTRAYQDELLELVLRKTLSRFEAQHKKLQQQKEAFSRQAESEARYLALVEAASDSVVIVQDGLIRYANQAAAKAVGCSPEHYLNQPFLDFLSPTFRRPSAQGYLDFMEQGPGASKMHILLKGVDRGGAERDFEFSSTRITYQGQPAMLAIGRDVTEKRKAEKALEESEGKYRAVFNSGTDLIMLHEILLDKHAGPIADVNRAACTLLGYEREELLRLSPRDITFPEELPKIESQLRQLFRQKEIAFETRARCKDGNEVLIEMSLSLFRLGNRVFVLTNGRDIRERKKAEAELRQAKENAEAGNRIKAQFLANMGHELKTPINGILGISRQWLDSMEKAPSDALQTIHRSAKSLLHVIDDILDFSKLEAGQCQLRNQVFDLEQLLEDMAALFSARAFEKNLGFEVQVPPGLPSQILGDAVRIRQVLSNLIDNALKFTQHGQVNLKLTCAECGPGQVQCSFSVQDTGIGIAPEEVHLIFERFHRSPFVQERGFPGIGLGLSISKHLIELMGGTLDMESQLGKGSRFRFSITLPVEASKAHVGLLQNLKKREQVPNDQPASSAFKVLVVEDNETNQQVIGEILKRLGCQVEQAFSGEEAIAHVAKNHYDLVFMDWQMPGMNGREAALRLRSQKSRLFSRIIGMTAYPPDYFGSDMDWLWDDFIQKPASLNDFRTVLARQRQPSQKHYDKAI